MSGAIVMLAKVNGRKRTRQALPELQLGSFQGGAKKSRWEIEMLKLLRRHRSKGRPSKPRRDRPQDATGRACVYICRDGRGRIIASR